MNGTASAHHNREDFLASLHFGIQRWLFPAMANELGPLDDNERQFLELWATIGGLFPANTFGWCGNGRPPTSRSAMLRVFLAKALWNFATTRESPRATYPWP